MFPWFWWLLPEWSPSHLEFVCSSALERPTPAVADGVWSPTVCAGRSFTLVLYNPLFDVI